LTTESEMPSSPPFARITTARISMGTNETAANVSIARTATRTPRWLRTRTIPSAISPNTHQAGALSEMCACQAPSESRPTPR
jgi:hypothetical protein